MEIVEGDVTQNVDPRLIHMFTKPEGRVGVMSTFTHFVQPARPPSETDDEYVFQFPHLGAAYADLRNTVLYLKGRLKHADKSKLAAGEEVMLENNALHSLFEAITLYVGHNQVEIYQPHHPIKAFLRQLMQKALDSPSLKQQGFSLHTRFEGRDDYTVGMTRRTVTESSKVCELIGPTYIDMFQTPGYLMPGTPLTVKY